ncbi:MAG: hypothetical protein AMXMBFR78_11430 [Rubrivivax sp.]|jgi:hypothetical protein
MQRELAACSATGIFIGVDVRSDGRLFVTLWRDGRPNAIYMGVDSGDALGRVLPQAVSEAVEMAAQPLGASAESGV